MHLYAYARNNPLTLTDPTGMYCYYGEPDSEWDLRDPSQYDFHSTQAECETPDENGNRGQWINDLRTHQDGSGQWVDDEGRPENNVPAIGEAPGSTRRQPTEQDAINDVILDSLPGWIDDVFEFLVFTPENRTDPFRLFTTRYCGPGGGGGTTGTLDSACQTHDNCYNAAGLSTSSNLSGTISLAQAVAAQACNQALYDVARKNPDAPGSKAIQYWLTKGDKVLLGVPFAGGYHLLAPGTAARPW